jgi:hypothetical protein
MDTIVIPMFIRSMWARPFAMLLAVLLVSVSVRGADMQMKVTDKGYLDAQGFSVILYNSTFHPVFVDQKNTAMEMILHGQRIATNGDVRLVPTPEQWDLWRNSRAGRLTRTITDLLQTCLSPPTKWTIAWK